MEPAARLRDRLISSGIARPEDIAGCTPAELARLERAYGPLPESYKALIALIGHRAGRLVDGQEFALYFDQLDQINADARQSLADWAEDGRDPGVPDNAFFISARYREYPSFLLTGEAADSAVFMFNNDTCAVVPVAATVWDWIADHVRDAEHWIALGVPERSARRG